MYHSIQFNQIFSVPDTVLSSTRRVRDIIPNTLHVTGHDILKTSFISNTAITLTFISLPNVWGKVLK